MAAEQRFVRDPNTSSRRRAAALVEADEMLHAALIQARHAQGLTQLDVADRMGVTQPTVAGFERYDNDPRLSTVRRYAHAVGVVVTHSVERDGVPVSCGWTPASSAGLSFSVSHAAPAVQVVMAAADTAKTDFSLAA